MTANLRLIPTFVRTTCWLLRLGPYSVVVRLGDKERTFRRRLLKRSTVGSGLSQAPRITANNLTTPTKNTRRTLMLTIPGINVDFDVILPGQKVQIGVVKSLVSLVWKLSRQEINVFRNNVFYLPQLRPRWVSRAVVCHSDSTL